MRSAAGFQLATLPAGSSMKIAQSTTDSTSSRNGSAAEWATEETKGVSEGSGIVVPHRKRDAPGPGSLAGQRRTQRWGAAWRTLLLSQSANCVLRAPTSTCQSAQLSPVVHWGCGTCRAALCAGRLAIPNRQLV